MGGKLLLLFHREGVNSYCRSLWLQNLKGPWFRLPLFKEHMI